MAGILGGDSTAGLINPDQAALEQQQGWYPRPDMVLPTGVPNTQPQGYSNLTPAQTNAVNQLGYYTQPGAGGDTLWDRLKAGIGSGQLQAALKDAGGAFQTPQALANRPLPPMPPHQGFPLMNPRHNLYTQSYLDPQRALAQLRGLA